MFKLIDDVLDRIAQRLADNLCENSEAVEQNRHARMQGITPRHEMNYQTSSEYYIFTA